VENNWKIVKARKDHECESCQQLIKKGELYELLKARIPKFDDKDNQIGIEFIKIKCHRKELYCFWSDDCKKGNHKEMYYTDNHPDSRNYGDTFCCCEECGTDLSDIKPINRLKKG